MEDERVNRRSQLLCVYSGYVWVGAFIIGWALIARFVPPPDPSDGARVVAARFARHTTSIRVGLLICLAGAAFVLPWYAAIVTQVKRLEGRHSPLTYVQIGAGACLVVEFVLPLMFWENAAFRQDGSAELVQRLNDLAWLPFLGIVSTAVMSAFAFGIAVLKDPRDVPVFPRWLAYLNFWCGTLFAPGGFIVLFKDGPLAWNGILAFWVVFVAFSVWAIAMTVMVARAIRAQPEPGPSELDLLRAEVADLRREVSARRD